jgi:hypothetical protein
METAQPDGGGAFVVGPEAAGGNALRFVVRRSGALIAASGGVRVGTASSAP